MAADIPKSNPLAAEPRTVPISALSASHRKILTRAITNMLFSPIAETTYGQIVDGVPTSKVAVKVHFGTGFPGHPMLWDHDKLPEPALEKVRELRGSLNLNKIVLYDESRAHAFAQARQGSREFKTRLVELVAMAVHQIAAWLFQHVDTIRPKDDPLLTWRPDPDDFKIDYPWGFPPTFFRHHWYKDYDQYPDGVADGVGYWAESQILGGVVLFDRREPGSAPDVDPHAIYFHSDRYEVTYRIFRLLDSQKHQLLSFLLATDPPVSACPLPILGGKQNAHRIDPQEPMKDTGVYRDRWERKAMTMDEADIRQRDVIDLFNFLSFGEYSKAQSRALKLQKRLWDGENLDW